MKKINIFVLAFAILFFGCESFIDEVPEKDPTRPVDATTDLILTGLVPNYIGAIEGDLTRVAGIWSGHFSGEDRQYSGYQNYQHTAGDFDATWATMYWGVVKQALIIEEKASAVNDKLQLGVAQVIRAHVLGTAAAAWGDIPFDEAGNLEQFPNPTYESQTAVYGKVQSLLTTAIGNLESGIGAIEGDPFFDGDEDKWIKVAHSLKAKFFLHTENYTNALLEANMGITSAADEFIAPHGTTYGQDFNIFYSFAVYDRTGYIGANAYAIDLILPTASNYRGNAKTNEEARANYLFLDEFEIYGGGYEINFLSLYDFGYPDGYFGTETDYELLSYRENQLTIAECELRLNGFNAGLNALNTYRGYLNGGGYLNPDYPGAALGYGSTYLDYNASDFAPGGMENSPITSTLSASDALYREIVEERYVSLIGHLEGYFDIRRMGFGSFASQQNWVTLGITPNTGTDIPQRFLYSQNEINSNTSTPSPIPALFDKTAVFQ